MTLLKIRKVGYSLVSLLYRTGRQANKTPEQKENPYGLKNTPYRSSSPLVSVTLRYSNPSISKTLSLKKD